VIDRRARTTSLLEYAPARQIEQRDGSELEDDLIVRM
jgi:hypothetical protein